MIKLKNAWMVLLLIASILPFGVLAEGTIEIKLPTPKMEGGKPLMEVLKERKTSRSFSDRELSLQELSNLLWAAFGVNRTETSKRTAPSAMNRQDIDIYVAKKDGLFRYDALKNTLVEILAGDIRGATGVQDFVKDAPVNLVYVSDFQKWGDAPKESRDFYSAANAGFIAQNVYLYCASEGLATVIRGMVDRDKLHGIMKLNENQKIILSQTVGYPAEK
jgi:SagB-type dehydrogenase family enzyme